MDVVSELCDTVTVLDGGKIIAEGKPTEVNRDPAVIAAYLGSSAADPGTEPVIAGVSRC
jgi:branched-chain amino acid transport system permease protein